MLHLSDELGELSQWHCHDDSTINIVMAVTITVVIIITCSDLRGADDALPCPRLSDGWPWL